MNWNLVYESVLTIVSIAVSVELGIWVLNRLRPHLSRSHKPEARVLELDDMPTTIIRKIEFVPRLEHSKQVIFRPGDYAYDYACVDPDCQSPRIEAGQIVERITTSRSFMFVCLDCLDRSQQRFAEAME